jgi:hypothetical protein
MPFFRYVYLWSDSYPSNKEVDNMKRLIVILMLAVVMCAAEGTYSQSQESVDVPLELEEIFKGLVQCRDEIADLEDNTRAIPNEFSALHAAGLSTMETARWIYEYFISALVWHDCTTAECEPLWRPATIAQLRRAKTQLNEIAMNRLHQAFMKGKISEASNKHVIARNIIRSSLPLIDRLTQILESEQKRKKIPNKTGFRTIFKMIK